VSVADRPWPAGAATSIGSLPGLDPAEAVRLVFGELPLLPFLPELPDRGPGAGMIGRTSALLAELPVEIQPSGWRLTAHPGQDLRRARDFLARDLDALEEHAAGYDGAFKLQVTGPWTMAAWLELPSGHRVVSDHGAVRDLAESLAEGIQTHVADVARRLPAATIVVQLDEPSLPAVLAARIKTPSGFGTVRAVGPNAATKTLQAVLSVIAPGRRIVHCCDAAAPIALLRDAGADAISIDATSIDVTEVRHLDVLGEAVDAGVSLWLGVIGSSEARVDVRTAREVINRIWQTLGFSGEALASSVVPTSTCGLAGTSPDYARRALGVLRETGESLFDVD
jgi:methionine synthase II (cobalamin-independent)